MNVARRAGKGCKIETAVFPEIVSSYPLVVIVILSWTPSGDTPIGAVIMADVAFLKTTGTCSAERRS